MAVYRYLCARMGIACEPEIALELAGLRSAACGKRKSFPLHGRISVRRSIYYCYYERTFIEELIQEAGGDRNFY